MNDEFDKSNDDEFDWLNGGEDDDTPSQSDTGLTGQLDWQQVSSDDDSETAEEETPEFDWLDGGEDDNAPSQSGTGLTGQLDWQQAEDAMSETNDGEDNIEEGLDFGTGALDNETAADLDFGTDMLADDAGADLDFHTDELDQGALDLEFGTGALDDASVDLNFGIGEEAAESDSEMTADEDSEEPDWLANAPNVFDTSEMPKARSLPEENIPDWLRGQTGELQLPDENVGIPDSADDTPDWLIESSGTFDKRATGETESIPNEEIPAWLRGTTGELTAPDNFDDDAYNEPQIDEPDWLRSAEANLDGDMIIGGDDAAEQDFAADFEPVEDQSPTGDIDLGSLFDDMPDTSDDIAFPEADAPEFDAIQEDALGDDLLETFDFGEEEISFDDLLDDGVSEGVSDDLLSELGFDGDDIGISDDLLAELEASDEPEAVSDDLLSELGFDGDDVDVSDDLLDEFETEEEPAGVSDEMLAELGFDDNLEGINDELHEEFGLDFEQDTISDDLLEEFDLRDEPATGDGSPIETGFNDELLEEFDLSDEPQAVSDEMLAELGFDDNLEGINDELLEEFDLSDDPEAVSDDLLAELGFDDEPEDGVFDSLAEDGDDAFEWFAEDSSPANAADPAWVDSLDDINLDEVLEDDGTDLLEGVMPEGDALDEDALVPAANLDSLLSSFDVADEAGGEDDEFAPVSDFDQLFDNALPDFDATPDFDEDLSDINVPIGCRMLLSPVMKPPPLQLSANNKTVP